jgi:hypothetical protein
VTKEKKKTNIHMHTCPPTVRPADFKTILFARNSAFSSLRRVNRTSDDVLVLVLIVCSRSFALLTARTGGMLAVIVEQTVAHDDINANVNKEEANDSHEQMNELNLTRDLNSSSAPSTATTSLFRGCANGSTALACGFVLWDAIHPLTVGTSGPSPATTGRHTRNFTLYVFFFGLFCLFLPKRGVWRSFFFDHQFSNPSIKLLVLVWNLRSFALFINFLLIQPLLSVAFGRPL